MTGNNLHVECIIHIRYSPQRAQNSYVM